VAVASLHFDGSHTRPCGLGPGGFAGGLVPAEPAHLARGGPDVKARPGAGFLAGKRAPDFTLRQKPRAATRCQERGFRELVFALSEPPGTGRNDPNRRFPAGALP